MAVRPDVPERGSIATTAVVALLAGCLIAPAWAAPDRSQACREDRAATLDISRQELTLASHEVSGSEKTDTAATTIESVADDHLLKPRVEAAARKVFANGEEASEDDAEADAESEEVSKPLLRSMSESQPVPFRRQMYRKDI